MKFFVEMDARRPIDTELLKAAVAVGADGVVAQNDVLPSDLTKLNRACVELGLTLMIREPVEYSWSAIPVTKKELAIADSIKEALNGPVVATAFITALNRRGYVIRAKKRKSDGK